MESEIDYTQELDYLFNNLKSTLLYYLTEIISEHPVFIKSQLDFDTKSLNQILFFDKNRKVHFEITTEDFFEILEKKKLLEANIFKLLQLKSNLNKETYTFIRDKYAQELKIHLNNAKILNNIYEEACFVKSDLLKNCLIAQEQIFNNHFNEITQRFFMLPLPKVSPGLKFANNIIKSQKPRLKDLILKGNPEVIEKIIVDNFKNSRNITIHRMFIALEKLEYIKIEHGSRKHLLECLNNSIGIDKFKLKSVFVKEIDFMSDKEYFKTRNQILSLIDISNNKN